MKKKMYQTAIGVLVAGSLVFTACQKDKDAQMPAAENQTAVDANSAGMAESDDVLSIVESTMSEANTDKGGRVAAGYFCGAIVTITPPDEDNSEGEIIIDFGDTDKSCSEDSRKRRGKIIVKYTGKYREDGKMHTVMLENYYVNGNKVEGTKEVTHKLADGKIISTIYVNGGKITYTDKTFITWDCDRQQVWDSKGTFTLADDELTINSFMASGTSRDGIAYEALITTPLLYTVSCARTNGLLPISGILEIKPNGFATRMIDFGDGTCDRVATLTIEGKKYTYTVEVK